MRPKSRPRSSGRVNLDDIARHVGVARITVSRALSRPEKVSPATRERVEQAAQELGYVPDLVASSLASQRSGVVALILPTVSEAHFADSVRGLTETLATHGIRLIIGDSGYSQDSEASLVAAMLGRRPDAIVLVGSQHAKQSRRLLRSSNIPVIEIWELPEDPLDSVVGFSNHLAAKAMTQYLIKAGRKSIGFLSTRATNRGEARLGGFLEALAEAGLPGDAVLCPEESSLRLETATEFAKLRQRYPRLDAIVCADDLIAIDAIFACMRHGISVPDDIAITGFCDLDIARQAYPSLTTVRIPAYQIGCESARLILDRLEDRNERPVRLDLGFEIISRESA